ncbi:glycosyltransferase family 1 protein [soil metagenome]
MPIDSAGLLSNRVRVEVPGKGGSMKIAMVCLSGGEATAHPRRIADLSAALARQGHRVTMYTSREASPLMSERDAAGDFAVVTGPAGAHEANADPELLQDLGPFTRFLEDQWARDTPDLAHAHYWCAGLATQLAARSQQIPTVQTFHSLGRNDHNADGESTAPTRRRLEALVARGSSWLIASHTEEMLELGRMGGRRSRMTVVPCGVDIDAFAPQGPAARRGELHRIVAVGSVAPGRGYDTLIASLRLVPNAELLIVGKVAAPDPSRDVEVSRLTQLALRSGVADRVKFHGEVPHADMPALLRSADVVACLPQHESFGIVALEAMACGVPVVASEVGGLTDTVISDVTGRLVSANKPRECAEAILPLLKQPFTRNSLGAAGRDRARSRYSWDRIAIDTARVYQRLVPEVGLDVSPQPAEQLGADLH